MAKSSPNTITFHEDGTMSYRIDGRWSNRRKSIPREDYFSFSEDLRAKLSYYGYELGRELVKDLKQVGNFVWPYS